MRVPHGVYGAKIHPEGESDGWRLSSRQYTPRIVEEMDLDFFPTSAPHDLDNMANWSAISDRVPGRQRGQLETIRPRS